MDGSHWIANTIAVASCNHSDAGTTWHAVANAKNSCANAKAGFDHFDAIAFAVATDIVNHANRANQQSRLQPCIVIGVCKRFDRVAVAEQRFCRSDGHVVDAVAVDGINAAVAWANEQRHGRHVHHKRRRPDWRHCRRRDRAAAADRPGAVSVAPTTGANWRLGTERTHVHCNADARERAVGAGSDEESGERASNKSIRPCAE